VSDTDKTLIVQIRHLLWFKIRHAPDGKIHVHNYKPPRVLEPEDSLAPDYLATWFGEGYTARPAEKFWTTRIGSTERIIAQIARLRTEKFSLHYYSIGLGDKRLASYFILDGEEQKQTLPGHFDYQAPVELDNMIKFFGLAPLQVTSPDKWAHWEQSTLSLKQVHRFTIVLRLRDGDTEYLGLDARSALHEYPYGRLVGGLPFGAEDRFLALCRLDPDKRQDWDKAIEAHETLFNAWNVICRKDTQLKRIFITGDPGSGKEVWSEAIQKGSKSHRKGKWKTLSATLPTADLKLLLYGERSGALERPGFLDSCAGGGVFLDEIGKSHPEFRRDLLRVLEAGEFVPIGGLPTKIRNVLFVFASTQTDRKAAYDPPDFWTRMDVELSLSAPIMLLDPEQSKPPMSGYDDARFHSLLGHFWFLALTEKRDNASVDVDLLLGCFREKVFTPIVDWLAAARQDWPLNDDNTRMAGIPVSPRRIRSLATTLSSEYQWVGDPSDEPATDEADSYNPERKTAEESYKDFLEQFVSEFFQQLVRDERNKKKSEQEVAERERRAKNAAERPGRDGLANDT